MVIIMYSTDAGEIHLYNKEQDRARTYKQLPIAQFTGTYYNVDTLEDPIFQRLAKENKADIFATETAVAAIMTAPKSIYSWDVIIKKY
jgi:translation initiation factor 3 subunit D